MKLFIKVLLYVLVALVANMNVTSASISFTNIQEATTSFSFHNETLKTIYKVIKNDEANCCQNPQDLVVYRDWGIGVEAVATKTGTSLVKTGTQWRKHSLQRLAERGVTKDMAEMAIIKGQKFYDPLNKSINYVLPNGYASGKSLLVGTNPLTGEVTTVIRSSKNLINKRFIPIK